MKEAEKSLDPQLWYACAGSMVQMPDVNSKVLYFPQGHAEHAHANVDFAASLRIPALIRCRVVAVKFLADPETDEVYAKIQLISLGNTDFDYDDDCVLGNNWSENSEKPASFVKTLTQSDANNGGGFSVPRYCAETIFPRLDYSADPPVQTVMAKDVRGETWKFRHIYRGTPRRHLLTTGWSNFVNQKKLVAGDSIVFLRADNGDLCVGIRRTKRGIGCGLDFPSGGSTAHGSSFGSYRPFPALLRDEENKLCRNGCGNSSTDGGNLRGRGKVRAESVTEAAALAASGQPFEVVYYPRTSTPEFCVKESSVKAAMRIHWCSGMRFKMAFETEDSSRISWFMGTVTCVQVVDPIRWPNSPWRLLHVSWDEPDLLQNVKRVSPWLIELVSNMPYTPLSPFSPPRKKMRPPQQADFTLDGQFPWPPLSVNPLGSISPLFCLSDNAPAGIQGARHAQFGISLSDFHLGNKQQVAMLPSSLQRLEVRSRIPNLNLVGGGRSNDSLPCLLKVGNSTKSLEKSDGAKRHQFLLFGQPILTEQQISGSCSGNAVSENSKEKYVSDEIKEKDVFLSGDSVSTVENQISPEKSASAEFLGRISFHTGHCKVFMESEDLGRTLDLSLLSSYEELYMRLANMFGIDRAKILHHVLYRDLTGAVKHAGDEPYSEFVKEAKRLTIMTDAGNQDIRGTWITGLRNGERGLDSSNKTGPLSIFA